MAAGVPMPAREIACGGVPGQARTMVWLPVDFMFPTTVAVGDGYHLRPIRAADVDLDYPAVMGSQPRLWSIFGEAWGWPSDSMTYEQDLADLARHEAEIAARQSFNYALLDDAETALLGCVYLDPPEKQGAYSLDSEGLAPLVLANLRGGDVAMRKICDVAQDDRRTLARRQLVHGLPKRLVRRRWACVALGGAAVLGDGDVRERQRTPRPRAVGVERLAVGDRENPRAQVRVATQPRVRAQRGDERLLEAVVGLARTDGRDEKAPYRVAVCVEKALEGRQLRAHEC